MISIMPFGSCRIHRPFIKFDSGILYKNLRDNFCLEQPGCGFFHSPFEIGPVLNFLIHGFPSSEFLPFVFRKENPRTTPGNEFSSELENSILTGRTPVSFLKKMPDILLLEISSLSYFRHPSGLFFHHNPNFKLSASYSDIYPDGYYNKFFPELSVVNGVGDVEGVADVFFNIKRIIGNTKVVVVGHLVNPAKPNAVRVNVNSTVEAAASVAGFNYFDNTKFVEEYGYLIDSAGNIDIHHLTHRGELAYGQELQNFMENI